MRPTLAKSASSSSLSRRNYAYVDIPPSPFHTMQQPSGDLAALSSKENTPLRPSRSTKDTGAENANLSTAQTRKRKLSNASSKRPEPDNRVEKRSRLSASVVTADDDKVKPPKTQTAVNPDPSAEAVFYCHQCNKKRVVSDGIQCTRKSTSPRARDGRCLIKYCRSCLMNRYNENMDALKARDTSSFSKEDRKQHIPKAEYYFECPRCKDICNCRVCRKAKGLEPTGRLWPAKQDVANVKVVKPTKGPTATTSQPASHLRANGMRKYALVGGSTSSVTKSAADPKRPHKANGRSVPGPKTRAPRAKPAPPPKPFPRPLWTRISTTLTQTMAEARIHIREFVQRFSSILDIAKGHLEELEEIAGTTGEHGALVGDDQDDEVEGWVSEPCAKAIILSLLTIITDGTENGAMRKVAKGPISDIRASGANLNKIWLSLAALRDGLRSIPSLSIQIPDPLPPPLNVTYRTTRGTHQIDTAVYVGNSAQLIPVITALIETAVQKKVIRAEFDFGVEQDKALAREAREETSRQKALWEESKVKGKSSTKAEREQHKQGLQDIDFAHRIISSNHAPRYAPLGQDCEGRVYYILTPSEAEREAALQLIAGKDAKVKFSRRRGGLTEDCRREMRRWTWFVAVWGKAPEAANCAEADSADDDAHWWGFYDPDEICKLAEWNAMKSALDDVSRPAKGNVLERTAFGSSPASSRAPSPMSDLPSDEDDDDMSAYVRVDAHGRPVATKTHLQEMVKGLRDFAELLQWRIRRASGDATNGEKEAALRSAIPTKKFYH